MVDRIAPNNLEAEMSIIGSLLLDSEFIGVVTPIFNRNMFYLEKHALIYDAILELWDSGVELDIIQLCELIKRKGQIEESGGPAYISACVEIVPTPENIVQYVEIVVEKWKLRSLIKVINDATNEAYMHKKDSSELIESFADKVDSILKVNTEIETECGKISDFEESLEKYDLVEDAFGLSLGFAELDENTGGGQEGDLIVIMGRPETLKTWIALYIAYKNYIKGKNILIIELEMNRRKIKSRLESFLAKVESRKIRRKQLDDEEMQRYKGIQEKVSMRENDIYILTRKEIPICSIKTVEMKVKQYKPNLLIVDNLLEVDSKLTDIRQAVVKNTRGLKRIAESCGIPIIVLHHTTKEKDKGIGTPSKDVAAESDAIAQVADVLLHLQMNERMQAMNQLFCGMAKNRDNPKQHYVLHVDLTIPLIFVEESGVDLLKKESSKAKKPSFAP